MKSDTITKLVLNAVEKKLQETIQELTDAGADSIPFHGHVKKEKDKYSTYLRQVQDILQLFEK
jgi:hypothetical protein